MSCDRFSHDVVHIKGKADTMVNLIMQLTFPVGEYEPPHDKTSKMICAPSEGSDQPGHLPSLIRVFDLRSVGS